MQMVEFQAPADPSLVWSKYTTKKKYRIQVPAQRISSAPTRAVFSGKAK